MKNTKTQTMLIIVAFLIILCNVVLVYDYNTISTGEIEQIMRDAFTPETMAQFDASYKKNSGTVFTEECAAHFYKKKEGAKELTEKDKTRRIVVYVSKGSTFYKGDIEKIMVAEMTLYGEGLERGLRVDFIFHIKGGKIYEFEVNRKN